MRRGDVLAAQDVRVDTKHALARLHSDVHELCDLKHGNKQEPSKSAHGIPNTNESLIFGFWRPFSITDARHGLFSPLLSTI
jgi:hypothetical protein